MSIAEYCYYMVKLAKFIPDDDHIVDQYMIIYGRETLEEVQQDLENYKENANLNG